MEHVVYVLAKDGDPLMPTKRFGKVAKLLDNNKAKVVKKKPFTIQLLYESKKYTQPLTLGIDPGTDHIGTSVTKENGSCVYAGELETRTREITKRMSERKMYRQQRRKHKRNKKKRRAKRNETSFGEKQYKISGCQKEIIVKDIKPGKIKFQNRKRLDYWFTPTCKHAFLTHVNFTNKILKILPISHVVLEYSKFDTQKLKNPDVHGTQYQNGRMKDFTNVQEYVLERDNHICQLCKKSKDKKLESHHIIWRSQGGSDLPENQMTLCQDCHDKVHKDMRLNDKVVKMSDKVVKNYAPVTILNTIIPHLYNWLLCNFGKNLEVTYGYETKNKRREFSLEKSHWIDAYLVSIGDKNPVINGNESCFSYKQFRKHNRANINQQEDRKYYLDDKKIANNRNKRMGQTTNSLKDVNLDPKDVRRLTVRPGVRAYRKVGEFNPGDLVKYNNKTFITRGFTGSYLYFLGQGKQRFSNKKCKLIKKNKGICCIS